MPKILFTVNFLFVNKYETNRMKCNNCNEEIINKRNKKYCDKCKHINLICNNCKNNFKILRWKYNSNTFRGNKKYYCCRNCADTGKTRLTRTQYDKKYNNTNKGIRTNRNSSRRRRAKMNNIKELFTMEQWNKKLDETHGVCPNCKRFIGKIKLTLDHIYPISKAEEGRVYTIDDIQPICKTCNSSKGVNIHEK